MINFKKKIMGQQTLRRVERLGLPRFKRAARLMTQIIDTLGSKTFEFIKMGTPKADKRFKRLKSHRTTRNMKAKERGWLPLATSVHTH